MIELQQNSTAFASASQQLTAVVKRNNRKFLITPSPSGEDGGITTSRTQSQIKLTTTGTTKPTTGTYISISSFFNEAIKYDVTMNCNGNANPQINADTYDDIKNNLLVTPLFRSCNMSMQHPTSLDRLNNYNDWCMPNDDTIDMVRKGDDFCTTDSVSLSNFNLKYKQNQIPFSNKTMNGRTGNVDDKPYVYQHFNNWRSSVFYNFCLFVCFFNCFFSICTGLHLIAYKQNKGQFK